MYRYRAPLPRVLRAPQGHSPRPYRSPCSVPRLPSLDPTPREIYAEQELLLQQKFALSTEIQSLTSEIACLRASLDRVLVERNEREEFEITVSRKMNEVTKSEAQSEVYELTPRQVTLQQENEKLEDECAYLSKFFGPEAADQIRTEVGLERTVIGRLKAEVLPLVEGKQKIEERLKELSEAERQFLDNKSEIDRLSELLRTLGNQYQETAQALESGSEANRLRREQEEEFVALTKESEGLRAQKFAKKKQMENLARVLNAKLQGVVNKRASKMLLENSVYDVERFHKNLHEQSSSVADGA
jgi:hypothetical protein